MTDVELILKFGAFLLWWWAQWVSTVCSERGGLSSSLLIGEAISSRITSSSQNS